LSKVISELGEPGFRITQIKKWLYQKRIDSFDQMNNMPKLLRQKMSSLFAIDKMPAVYVLQSKSRDAVKFGFRLLHSNNLAESVLLIDGDRRTACISSQFGCGLGCTFCETGKMGFIRNLTQEEIIGQLIGINDYLHSKSDKLVTNIVFMGMGEALSNFDNFLNSLSIIMSENAFNIGGRRITVSTAGVVPSIEKLIDQNLNIGLAISLNSYSNIKRSEIMPINNHYPIESLIQIARKYFNKTGRRVTFEYVIIDGETNTAEAASALQNYLGGLPCKINLIPINPSKDSNVSSPPDYIVAKFAEQLNKRGLSTTIRKSRGQDIWGACGQLAGSDYNSNL
ncbi:MAG: 23S rRNA (adenine(2503)-C(2))-methyltransferase RlmN, partial [Fibrobacter sp.]|nr:23S rRNA (adenine(2503)-C(2))-methyltransferase RlmN [Fibrobacter sp.]